MSKLRNWLVAHRDYRHEDWCLLWPFARDRREGRALANVDGHKLAHRWMCEAANGKAPIDKPQAAHSCGNGHLGCVNPRHLSWATNSENQHQRYAHGRHNPNPEGGNRSRFTPEQIEKMRSQWGEFTQEKLAEMYGVKVQTIQYYLKYREAKGHAGGKVKHWHPDEDDRLREGLANGEVFEQIGLAIGRSWQSVRSRSNRLGLKRAA